MHAAISYFFPQTLWYEYSQNIILAKLLWGSESPLFYMNSIKA